MKTKKVLIKYGESYLVHSMPLIKTVEEELETLLELLAQGSVDDPLQSHYDQYGQAEIQVEVITRANTKAYYQANPHLSKQEVVNRLGVPHLKSILTELEKKMKALRASAKADAKAAAAEAKRANQREAKEVAPAVQEAIKSDFLNGMNRNALKNKYKLPYTAIEKITQGLTSTPEPDPLEAIKSDFMNGMNRNALKNKYGLPYTKIEKITQDLTPMKPDQLELFTTIRNEYQSTSISQAGLAIKYNIPINKINGIVSGFPKQVGPKSNRKINPEIIAQIQQEFRDTSITQIALALKFDISPAAVNKYLRGIRKALLPVTVIAQLRHEYETTEITQTELAYNYGVSVSSINKLVVGIDKPRVYKPGRISRETALKIQEEYSNGGISIRRLAENYGISRSTAFEIINNTWLPRDSKNPETHTPRGGFNETQTHETY